MLEMLLCENAFDSINHGFIHLNLAEKEGDEKDYKQALLSIFQGTELLLKQLLCLKNPILMFDKNSLYDKCVDPLKPKLEELFECKSLEVNKLCSEVKRIYPLEHKSINFKVIEKAARERNKIQHFGIQIQQENIQLLILELYNRVIRPAFIIIGTIIEDNDNSYNDYFNEKLNLIFNFFAIADREEDWLKTQNKNFIRMNCHHCGNFSLFVFYDHQSFPVRHYCSSCNNSMDKIDSDEFLICPECSGLSLIYDESIEAGTCLWYKCANNKDGGILVEMEYCTDCQEYRIEKKCKCNINDDD